MTVDLWIAVDKAFQAHNNRGLDPTPIDSLNRIFGKYVARDDLGQVPWLSPVTCEISMELYDRNQLAQLELFHGRASPARPGGPIVVVEYLGNRYVVDGNNRVSLWLRNSAPTKAEVIVIRPRDP